MAIETISETSVLSTTIEAGSISTEVELASISVTTSGGEILVTNQEGPRGPEGPPGTGLAEVTGLIGDGASNSFTITHNFNTRDVVVEVFENSDDYMTIFATVYRPTLDTVVIEFGESFTPSVDAYQYIVRGTL